MAKFESIMKWKLNCSQGQFDLIGVLDYDVGHDRKVAGVNCVGYGTPQGTVKTPGGYTLGFTLKIVVGEKLDWQKLQDSEEEFVLTGRYRASGKAVQFNNCTISNLPFSGDGDGKNELKVEIFAPEMKPL